jgi:hypothetical protein
VQISARPIRALQRTSAVNRRDVALIDAARRPPRNLGAPPHAPRLARGSHVHLAQTPEQTSEQTSTLDDPALFAAMARGDRDALAALYDRHATTLFAFALHMIGDRTRAEDLLHDTFLDLARHARAAGATCPPVLRWLVQRLFARGAATTG